MSNTMNARVVFSRHLCAALFCCGMALTASAGEWLIPSPDDGNEAAVTALTNALANCAEKDVVTLAKGVYDLSGVVSYSNETDSATHLAVGGKTITLRGDPSVTRDEVVLLGAGARILRLGKTKSWIENITFTNGWAQGAEFTGSSRGYGGAVSGAYGGAGDTCSFSNCVFRGNRADVNAGAVDGGTLYGCLVESNAATNGVAGALRYGRAYDTVFRRNEARNGGACHQTTLVRCTLEENVATGSGGACTYNCSATDCTFRYNAAGARGGAMNSGRTLRNCTFIGNSGVNNGGALYDQAGPVSNCWFESNWVSSGGSQGAICANATAIVLVQDCMFTNNAAGWGTGVGGNVAVWSNCVFVGNAMRSTGGGVAGPSGGTYYRCTFRGHWSTTEANRLNPTNAIAHVNLWPRMMSVSGGTLFDCTIEGNVTKSALTRCTLAGSTNAPVVVAANCALTNCLVVGNRLARDSRTTPLGVFYAGAEETPPTLVNCTVVDNAGTLFAVSGGAAVNTLFFGNTAGDGTAADISGGGSSAASLTLDHCLYGTSTASAEAVSFSDCVALAAGESPKFNAGQYADYPYYMPRRTSKAVDAGVALAWDADAVDRGGFPRVSGKAVDIGCYEACLPQNGFLMILR